MRLRFRERPRSHPCDAQHRGAESRSRRRLGSARPPLRGDLHKESPMRFHRFAIAAAMSCAITGLASAHEVEQGKGQLGKVTFANSCDAKVQADLQRAMAMLHSFWFTAGEQTFRRVLEQDPRCAIAHFGIAALMMNNP